MLPRDALTASLREAEKPALVAFVTAGFPDPNGFLRLLAEVTEAADAVRFAVPQENAEELLEQLARRSRDERVEFLVEIAKRMLCEDPDGLVEDVGADAAWTIYNGKVYGWFLAASDLSEALQRAGDGRGQTTAFDN